jgi:hypothetical protein
MDFDAKIRHNNQTLFIKNHYFKFSYNASVKSSAIFKHQLNKKKNTIVVDGLT